MTLTEGGARLTLDFEPYFTNEAGDASSRERETAVPFVMGDFAELGAVFYTVAISIIIMVVLGNWWAR